LPRLWASGCSVLCRFPEECRDADECWDAF
jgi:hypothetical protein